MKKIGLSINIGAKVGDAIGKLSSLSKKTSSIGKTVDALGKKRINLIANDSSVLEVKTHIEDVAKTLDTLKSKKTELSLKLDNNKVTELNNSIGKIEDKIDKLRDKENIIELQIKAETDEKELKKLNKSLNTTRKNILKFSNEKLEIKDELTKVRANNKKVNDELKKTSTEIKDLNSKKITLVDDLKKAELQAEKTNRKVSNITNTIKKINSAKISIKSTIHKTEIIKQKFMGNVGKVTAMSAGITGIAVGLGAINKETTQMANLAGTVGLSFGTVNTLGTAVKGIGLNYEHVTDIMEELNNKMGESKVKYAEWIKEGKGKGKELKLVGGVDDAFKGLNFGLSDKSFQGLNYEETFKKFTQMKGDQQFEIVLDTALKMKDEQKAASMVDILMGGEANKILSFLRKSGLSYKEFMAKQEKMNLLNKEGLKGAKEYSKVSAATSSILGSMFKQLAGIGGSFMTPILKNFNSWVMINKEIIQLNIKGFFEGISSAVGTMGDVISKAANFLSPLTSLFFNTSDAAEKAGSSGLSLGKSLAYIAGGFTALIGAKIVMGGLSMAVGVATTAFRALSIVARMNPIGLAVTAIAGGAYLIYRNWEGISSWFSSKWESVKGVFSSAWSGIQSGLSVAWNGIKALFNWSPLGVITNNWQPLLGFFTGIGSGIKNLFSIGWNGLKSALSWNPLDFVMEKWNKLSNFFSNFSLKDAGSKIIGSVVDGMTATWGKLTKKVGDITKSIRDFFPFSPAKRGALTDIHKIKLMETVASGINDKPLLKAVNNTTFKVRKQLALVGAGVALSGSLAVAQPTFEIEKSRVRLPSHQSFQTKANKNPISNRVFNIKENLLSKNIPNLKDRSFKTTEQLNLKNIDSLNDRTFKTVELYDHANISKVQNREFKTKEKLLTANLPTLKDRSFKTTEQLNLKNIDSLNDRTFKTVELYDHANISKVQNREFKTKEKLLTANLPTLNDRTFKTRENTELKDRENSINTPLAARQQARESIVNQTVTVNFSGETHIHNDMDKEQFMAEVEARVKDALHQAQRDQMSERMYD